MTRNLFFDREELKKYLKQKTNGKRVHFFQTDVPFGAVFLPSDNKIDEIIQEHDFLGCFVWADEMNITVQNIDLIKEQATKHFCNKWRKELLDQFPEWQEMFVVNLRTLDKVFHYRKEHLDQMKAIRRLVPEELKGQWQKLEKAFKDMTMNMERII